jgi:hypothetical protein
MPSTPPPPTALRRIHFYRANAGLDAAGRPKPFNPAQALRHIDTLPFTAAGRYHEIEAGQAVCCWPGSGTGRERLILGTIRRSGLPQVEHSGRLLPLTIPATQGLAEAIHVVFFPHGIVGSEFNFYGPRISRLGHYLEHKANGLVPAVVFEPLLRRDVLEQLRQLRDLRVVRLRIRASFADTVRAADRSLGDAFAAAAAAGQPEEVELMLKMDGRSGRSLADRLVAPIRRLAGDDRLRMEASHFSVRGLAAETHRVEEIDILRDHFIASKQIVRVNARSRALDHSAAYEAIIEAHRELRDQLEEAATIST